VTLLSRKSILPSKVGTGVHLFYSPRNDEHFQFSNWLFPLAVDLPGELLVA
jgi:hypothetical protein